MSLNFNKITDMCPYIALFSTKNDKNIDPVVEKRAQCWQIPTIPKLIKVTLENDFTGAFKVKFTDIKIKVINLARQLALTAQESLEKSSCVRNLPSLLRYFEKKAPEATTRIDRIFDALPFEFSE